MARRATDPTRELKTLHHRLNEAMEYAGYSNERGQLRRLAKASKIDVALLSRYRRGKNIAGITADMVVRLARFLNVSCGWLLASEGPAPWGELHTRSFIQRETAFRDFRGPPGVGVIDHPSTVIQVSSGSGDKHDSVPTGATPIHPRTPRRSNRK